MQKDVVVWSKDECFYCHMAKNILESNGIKYEERNISPGNMSEWTREDMLEAVPDAKTVPQILIEGKAVGGFFELQKHLEGI